MTEVAEARRSTPGSIALGWWRSLQPQSNQERRKGGNPGALARLRRADLLGAAMEEVTIDLFTRLASVSKLTPDALFGRAALIAAVLAHVREEDVYKVAGVAGEKISEEQRRMHPLRLRRLFAARSDAECLIVFRRLVALLGRPKRSDIVMDRLRSFPKGERAQARGHVASEAGRDWLAAQGAKAGFSLDRVDVITYSTEKIPRHHDKPIELGVLDLSGDITITNPELFLPALSMGFGKAKGFGCGLMLIRRGNDRDE
jgi:hypothetical protein